MGGREDNRVFVGGLAWETTERQLQDAFSRYGKIIECVVVVDRDTGRPRGFGFVTFADHRAMDDAITDMHGRELDGRVVSVNKAKPKLVNEDHAGFDYDRRSSAGRSDCFKCGRPGHFARECTSSDGSGRFSSQFSYGSGVSDRGDRFRIEHYDDRFNRGRYGSREVMDVRDSSRYGSRDRYTNDRYGERYAPFDRYSGDRFVDRELQNEYGRGRGGGYFRDGGPRLGGDRYGSGGPDRYVRGTYRERAGPYDHRHRRGDHLASYDRY